MEHNYVPKVVMNHELFKEFPEAKKLCKGLIKEYKSICVALESRRQAIQTKCFEDHSNIYEREFWTEIMIGATIDIPVSWYEKQIHRLEMLFKTDSYFEPFRKDRPISDFIQFDKAGFASCIWHNEKTASMKYYPKDNRVHCFGCSKSGDIIDVIQQLQGCSFKEALTIIK